MKKNMIAFLSLSGLVIASPNHEHPKPKISPDFKQLSTLVGTWEGVTKMSGEEKKMTVTYTLTSGGTALVEHLMAGTPDEMVTVYANRGNDVHVTHYCALGNQPEMKLKKATANEFTFEMDGMKGITNKNEMHMHAITLVHNGDHLRQEWTNYKDNKKGDTSIFEFTKKN